MKALALTAFLVASVNLSADIISLTCHESYTMEQLEVAYEEGSIVEPAGTITFLYDGYNTLMIDGEEVEVSDVKRIDSQFHVDTKIEKNNPMSPGQKFVFDRAGNNDFDGSLTVYNTGGFTGTIKTNEMLCLLSED